MKIIADQTPVPYIDEWKGLIKALMNPDENINKEHIIVIFITAFLVGFGVGMLIND